MARRRTRLTQDPRDNPREEEADDLIGSVEDVPEEEVEGEEVEDTPDGGAILRVREDKPEDGGWWDNLATGKNDLELTSIASSLLDLIDRDREARKKRDEQYEEGLKRTGLANDAPGGAKFQGASRVVHPMMIEATIDFSARAIKELWPPSGPVRDSIEGKITTEKVAKAKRKTALMNWQLTKQCSEFRAELEQLLTQVPMGGTQYLHLSWDERRNRPESLFVGVDEMLLPFAATNFYTAQRRTHVEWVTQATYEERVKEGRYRDVDLSSSSMIPEQTRAGAQSDKIEGRDGTTYNEDGLRRIYNVYTGIDLPFDDSADGRAPYIIVIDDTTRKVLCVYRNWEEDDEACCELEHFTEWPFIPWRGAYALGLPHIIGGLSAASTGALRALLDSAHVNNTPSALKMKGAKLNGQNQSVEPGVIAEIDGGVMADDIRKTILPFPFNPPSQTLFQLLGFLVEAARGVVRTSMDDAAEMRADAPVGTTLARMEQGLVVYSAAYGRLHEAMARTLRILHRLNGTYLDDEKLEKEVGEEIATRADFQGPMDVTPVSDPTIFSEAQRYAQVQAVVARADAHPEIYDQRKVEERVLETFKIPAAKDLLRPVQEPKEQNAANENTAASLGRPLLAFPEQDHLAHLQTHVAYMMNPLFGSSPLIAAGFIPVMLNHLREHIALWHSSAVFDIVSEALGQDAGDFLKEITGDSASRKMLDKLIAEATMQVLQMGGQVLASLPEVIQQAQQVLQQFPQPQDPLIEIETKKIEAKTASDQLDAQTEQARLAQQAKDDEADRQAMMADRQMAEQGDTERTQAEIEADLLINREDNQTAAALTLARLKAGSGPGRAASQDSNFNPRP